MFQKEFKELENFIFFLKSNQTAALLNLKKPKEAVESHLLKQNLETLEFLAAKLASGIVNGEFVIREELNQLRKKVQLANEERVMEINHLSEMILRKIDTFEDEC